MYEIGLSYSIFGQRQYGLHICLTYDLNLTFVGAFCTSGFNISHTFEHLYKGLFRYKSYVTLSAKSSLILGENKAGFRREGHICPFPDFLKFYLFVTP